MDAAFYGAIALVKRHAEAFRELELFMANNQVSSLALLGSLRVECGAAKPTVQSDGRDGHTWRCNKPAGLSCTCGKTEQAKGPIEITDEMVQRALESLVIGGWRPGDENDILLDHSRMRAALEAAWNQTK
jgi:hypothetical protein